MQKTFFKFSIVHFKRFNYICNSIGVMSILAITIGVLAII